MSRRWILMLLGMVPQLLYAQPEHSIAGLLHFHPQFNYLHPATAPEGTFHIGLPGISKVSALVNHRISYSDIFLSNQSIVDMLSSRSNSLGIEIGIGTFLLGYRSPKKHYFSLFVNEKASFFLYYPQNFVSLLWKGNTSTAGKTIRLGGLRPNMLSYREIGLSYSLPINKRLRLGLHAKYLLGLANIHVPRSAEAELSVDPVTFAHRLNFRNWRIHWANLPVEPDLQIGPSVDPMNWILNNNQGFAVSLGMSYRVSPSWDLNISLRDLGFIKWQNMTQAYTIKDTDILLEGINLDQNDPTKDLKRLQQELQDTIQLEALKMSYRTPLHYNFFSTLSWRMSRDNYLSASLGLQRIPSSSPIGHIRTYYSLSYMRQMWRHWSVSVSGIHYPQQITLGTAIAYQYGVFQLYGAVGNLLGLLNVPNMHIVDINFGINIITGRNLRGYNKKARLCP